MKGQSWGNGRPEDRDAQSIRVDLRWSLWTSDRAEWERLSPGTWDHMRDAFTGRCEGGLTVHLGPKKEIRFGRLSIRRGGVLGEMYTVWDSPEELAWGWDGEEIPEDDVTEYLAGANQLYDGDVRGATVTVDVRGGRWGDVVRKIDRLEGRLLREDAANSRAFDEAFPVRKNPNGATA